MDQSLSSNRQQCSNVGRIESVREKGNALNTDVAKSLLIRPPANQKSAAAATAVVMRESERPSPIEVTIDDPFIFIIRDIETRTILFVGRVVDPSA